MSRRKGPVEQLFEDMGSDPIGGLMMLGIAGTVLFYLLIAAVILAAILGIAAVILAGIVALYAAKSAKALVTEKRALPALWYSFVAAAGLTGGIMLSSVTILAVSPAAGDFFGVALTTPATGSANEIIAWLLGLAYDSIAFFIRLVPVCYLANRIFVARQLSGWAWLGVVPPVMAWMIFSLALHYDDVVVLLQNPAPEVVQALIDRTVENLWQPIRLGYLGFTNPEALVAYLKQEFVAAWPNLFKLAKFYPTAFFLYGTAVAGRAMAG